MSAAKQTLASKLARRIAREGPLTVADYMAAALTDPDHGYYMGRDPLGARGDFVTAPEVSQMFGELIGLWCADAWRRLGKPERVLLVELGPGRGTLLADALRAAQLVPRFLVAARPHLVEISPALKARQGETLAAARPTWHETFAEVPEGPLLVIANEFFDALPARQFVKRPTGWRERLVTLAEDDGGDGKGGAPRFVFTLGPATPEAETLIPAGLEEAPEGAVFEASPAAQELAADIARRLAAHGGAALIIDYGHEESAPGETLQAVRGHAGHDVLSEPGSADLTCHVDFEALAAPGREGGATVHGPVPQGAWLRRLGIQARAQKLMEEAAADERRDIAAGLDRLTGAAHMGHLFKVLALTGPGLGVPAGFG